MHVYFNALVMDNDNVYFFISQKRGTLAQSSELA